MDLNPKSGSKDIIKGIISCCFYAGGIFILFRGILLVSLPEPKKIKNTIRSNKQEEDLVIYSNQI